MLLEHIRFRNRQALKIKIESKNEIRQALQMLGLERKRPVIVMVGGAGGVRKEDWEPIREAITQIAKVAQNVNAVVIDGGTDSGIMATMGQVRSDKGLNFPLIGVSAEGTVKWPRRKMGLRERSSLAPDAGSLDPNHTHFILVPGRKWGVESSWIAKAATHLSGNQPSVAVLINGGRIARESDIPNNIEENRTVFVIEGTGRAADEFAAHPLDTNLMRLIHINDLEQLANQLVLHLHSSV